MCKGPKQRPVWLEGSRPGGSGYDVSRATSIGTRTLFWKQREGSEALSSITGQPQESA